jgi:hypothetical protein
MALGDSYITASDLKAYLGINDTDDDTLLTAVGVTATEWVNRHCQREFNKTTTASARVFRADNACTVEVDDFHTITDLVVKTDTGADGTYGTTVTSYTLEPSAGIVAGITGWPYQRVRFVASTTIPAWQGYPQVQVTAQWGWNAVPSSVTLATKIVGAYLFNLKDSPLGIAQFGADGLIRVRDIPQAAMLLEHYRRPGRTGPFLA